MSQSHTNNNSCPVCGNNQIEDVLQRHHFPVLQNRVYDFSEEAEQAPSADINLVICNSCGYAFNNAFDPSVIQYDEHYDNAVPSDLFFQYYTDIISYLRDTYPLKNGPVIDIGCGKGIFIKMLCDQLSEVSAIGVDPSFEEERMDAPQNLHFIKDVFRKEHIPAQPSILISRHVVEHIPNPLQFLISIRKAVEAYNDVPVFIEIPDLEWIMQNNTFWDFCYEHVNYFTISSITYLMETAGFHVKKVTRSFGEQYLWVEAVYNQSHPPAKIELEKVQSILKQVRKYAASENDLLSNAKAGLKNYADNGYKIVLWGMSTKGVIFSHLVDPIREYLDTCIDINPFKAGKYTPVSRHLISPPESLSLLLGEKILIIIMNPNYAEEIKSEARMHIPNAQFVNASFEEI